MHKFDPDDQSNEILTEKIDELESLIEDKHRHGSEEIPVLTTPADAEPEPSGEIPILNELVTDEPYSPELTASREDDNASDPNYTTEQLIELIDNLENKLTGELEALINTVKGSMKESIIEELQARLKRSPQITANPLPPEDGNHHIDE